MPRRWIALVAVLATAGALASVATARTQPEYRPSGAGGGGCTGSTRSLADRIGVIQATVRCDFGVNRIKLAPHRRIGGFTDRAVLSARVDPGRLRLTRR